MSIKTCSKESGLALQKAGVTVESYFRWGQTVNGLNSKPTWGITKTLTQIENWATIPAYTACELGEMLPIFFHTLRCDDGMYECRSYNVLHDVDYTSADTMAEAMALMLIWLLENGHITAEEAQ